MASSLMQHYIQLTKFLGQALGPDYEIALHDLTDKNRSIIAIANNHVSGREIGAPLSNVALKLLMDRAYEQQDSRMNFRGVSEKGKTLRSSTLFIKQNGRLVGMLCVNFDDSRYQAMSDEILSLCHPENFLERHYSFDENLVVQANHQEGDGADECFHASIGQVAGEAVEQELKRMGLTAKRLTPSERMQIIVALERDGIFLLKSAVKDVAEALGCSQASVYRYLSRTRREEGEGQEWTGEAES